MNGLRSWGGPPGTQANAIEGLAAALEPARIRFRALIVERILAFEAFRKLILDGDEPQRALANIAGLAHKISGVGATLGFAQAGGLAGALERCILDGRARLADPVHFGAEVEPLLEALLVAMEALLDD